MMCISSGDLHFTEMTAITPVSVLVTEQLCMLRMI